MIKDFQKYYGCVYITTNMLNGKQYTGQSIYPKDVLEGKYKGSGKYIKRAFNKYGWENFKCEIIEYIEDDANLTTMEERLQLQDKLDDREIYWIEKNKTYTPLGYNIAEGGNRGGFLLKYASEEDKKRWGEKISKAHKGNTYSLGRKYTIQTREKLSNASKGEKNPMYGRVGENSPHFGKKLSKEHRIKIGNFHKGKVLSNKTKLLISKANKEKFVGECNPFYGKFHTEETKTKMRKPRINKQNMKRSGLNGENHPMYGKKQSNEAKEKISKSHLNRPILKCTHCGLDSRSAANMKRYHFDNCKFKVN